LIEKFFWNALNAGSAMNLFGFRNSKTYKKRHGHGDKNRLYDSCRLTDERWQITLTVPARGESLDADYYQASNKPK